LDLENLVGNRTSELMLLNKKLESASQTDFLTGLNNRTGFINKFDTKNTLRSCIVLADIDHFKKINDVYGHLAGDQVLIDITKIMQSFIQKKDLVARWGGEEFIFYFHHKTPTETLEIIERIRIEIQNSKTVYSKDEIQVTCTFGICQIQAKMGLNDCIKIADESLYIGKSKGRNTAVVSGVGEK
jgi:diguanylate cyclase (GGDEF)-like protein